MALLLVLAGWGFWVSSHGCGSHLDADRLPSLLGGEPQGLAVAGLLFSILAPVSMVFMLSCWSMFG